MKNIILDHCDVKACADGLSVVTSEALATRMKQYRKQGFKLILTVPMLHHDNVGASGGIPLDYLAATLVEVRALGAHGFEFDDVSLLGPRVDTRDLTIDDKAVSLQEFVSLSYEEITSILAQEASAA